MLKELRFLPQKREMLDQLKAWESGRKSLHEIMLYIEKVIQNQAISDTYLRMQNQAISDDSIDAEWLVEAATPEDEADSAATG